MDLMLIKARILKHDCRRAAKLARLSQYNIVAGSLEKYARKLTEMLGRDEVDDAIDGLCQHQLYRHSFKVIQKNWDRHCGCFSKYPTAASWYASLIYFTSAAIPPWLDTGLENVLTGEECQRELENLIEDKIPDDITKRIARDILC